MPRTPILAGVALVVAGVALVVAAAAQAGEQYVDDSGFAASGHDVVAYFDLDQAPAGAMQPEAVPGRTSITAEHNGATFAFASAANRDRFLAEPAAFAPQYDGHCAYGVAQGGKVPGNPDLWRIVDGKLYLNITRSVVRQWEADIPGHLAASEANWAALEAAPASDDAVPRFRVDAPVE
jgi:hypothetical protein